jgi:DNA-binding NarL/FixJ family response regulator
MPKSSITVLLADDHHLVRRGFRRMLEDDPGIAVVGEAGDGQQAIDLALELRPDVVVMDFALPTVNGAAATRRILRSVPDTAVLMLSMHSEMSYVRASFDAGARGYLLKNAMDLELVQAVKQVAVGRHLLDHRLGTLEGLGHLPTQPQLTAREVEVLQLIAQGKSNKEVAAVLGLSTNTVNVHRANLMQTLGLHNTAELVLYAVRQGLVSIP